ncbi:retrovirus-related pol polyprotein from transposon TNT 1-94 [Tanacetum coccineum]
MAEFIFSQLMKLSLGVLVVIFDIWLAVKAKFEGNEESKKMRKSMLKQEFADFKISESEGGSSYDSRVPAAPSHSAFISAASTNSKWSTADSKGQPSSVSYTTTSSSANASGNVLENVLALFVSNALCFASIRFEKKAGRENQLITKKLAIGYGDDAVIPAVDAADGVSTDELKKDFDNLEVQYKECFIQVQAYKSSLQNLEQQKSWYQHNQLALEEKIRILTADLGNTTNMLKYTKKLNEQAKIDNMNNKVMLAIAAAGNDAAGGTYHRERQPCNPARPPSPSPTIPETEWVVPNPVSPVTDWRPWPYVPVHSPIRDPTPEPESPPTPPAQTFIFEEPLVFGPEPRPAGYVDPDVIEPIIFGPQPRPHGYVDPDFVEPIIFGPQPRPDNYLEPEDLDNIISMEDDTTHGGFHVESPVRPDDAPTPTADAAGRAEDPALLTGLSLKLTVYGTVFDSLNTDWKVEENYRGKRKGCGIKDDIDLDGLSRMASTALGHDQPAVPSEDVEEREEEGVPLRRKRSAYRRARTEFSTQPLSRFQANLSVGVLPHTAVPEPAGPSVAADKGKVPMPDLDIPTELLAEDAQARKRFEEEQASERLVQRLRAEDLAQDDCHNIEPLDDASWYLICIGKRDLDDVNEGTNRAPELSVQEKEEASLVFLIAAGCSAGSATPMTGSDTAGGAFGAPATDSTVTTTAAMDSAGSRRKIGVSPFADSAADPSPFLSSIAGGPSPSYVSTAQIPIAVLFESTSGGINEFFLESDEEEQIGMSRVVADPDSDDEVLAEIIFRGKSISGDGVVLVDKLPDDEIVDPRVKVETVSEFASSPPRSRRKHLGVRSDDFLWDKPVEDFFSSESESDDDMENYIPPLPYGAFKDWEIVRCPLGNNYYFVYYQENRRRKYFTYLKQLLPHVYREDLLLLRRRMNRYFRLNPEVDVGLELWRDVNMLCQSLHSDDVEDFWRTQDEWIVSSWKLYPKSSVHVLDLTNGKTVYMFVDKFYPIRATLLERMLRHRLTVPPSYCRDVVVAGNIIQTVQAGLRQAYECIASAPIACTARQMVFSSPWLTAKKESGSPLQTALVCNSNPLMVARLPKTGCPEQTATGKDMSNPLYGCDGLPKTVRVFQFTLDSRSEKLDWFLLEAAVLDVASTVSAACIVAAGYIVSAGICDAAGDIEENTTSCGIKSFLGYFVEAVIKDFYDIAFGLDFSEELIEKRWGKELANKGGAKFISRFDGSFVKFVKPSFCFTHSFDEGQVVTFNGEFVYGFRNGDCRTGSQSDNTVGNPHGFIIYWVVIFKNIKKVTKIVDVKNGVCLGSDNGSTSSVLEARVCIQGPERVRVFTDLIQEEKERYKADIRATNILLQGIPKDIYALINHYTDAKDIWENVKTLLFTKLINNMRNIKMAMPKMQLNSKFVNNMLTEWSRFVTEVKLNRGLRESNFDQLYAYLKQHKYPTQSSGSSQSSHQPSLSDNLQLDSGLTSSDNLIESLTNTIALLTQSYKAHLPQTNNQLKTSSNVRNKATVQDGKVVVQDNRVGNMNPGQAKPIWCYNCNGIGHIARQCPQPKRPQDSDYFKDKMLLMQAQENGAVLDEEKLLFLAGEQVTNFDDDVDDPPEQDLALNVDHVFEADQCDAFDSDVDEAPTTLNMFMVNLFSEDPIYEEVGPSHDTNSI